MIRALNIDRIFLEPQTLYSTYFILMFIKNLIFILLTLTVESTFADKKLSITPDISNEGYFTLNWKQLESFSPPYIIQTSKDIDFRKVIREISTTNPNQVHLSGFEDGKYYIRLLNAQKNQITNSVELIVKHQNLSHAFILFFIGLLLFIILITLIIRFNLGLGRPE